MAILTFREYLHESMEEQPMFDRKLDESSLSRVYRHNLLHDCGALTAWRKAEKCGEGRPYTHKENAQRNRSLLAKLKARGYGVTTLYGRYPEGGRITTEESYFVVDIDDTGLLETELQNLGRHFEQDSVLIIPKGTVDGRAKAFLLGTNRCPGNWIGFGTKEFFNRGKFGYGSKIYTSYVNGRPFIFEEAGDEVPSPGSGFGWWSLHRAANKHWSEL